MNKALILPSNFEFLNLLKKNNDRDWFNAHKDRYLKELENIENFADALLEEMNKHDVIETPSGKKVYTVFTVTFVFQKIKRLTTRIGAEVLHALQNSAEGPIIFIYHPEILL